MLSALDTTSEGRAFSPTDRQPCEHRMACASVRAESGRYEECSCTLEKSSAREAKPDSRSERKSEEVLRS